MRDWRPTGRSGRVFPVTVNVSELERRARELLRPEVYEYYAGGSGGEVTLRANDEAWRQVRFLPRVLRDVSAVRTRVTLGHPLNLELRTPIAVAPTAFHRLAHPQGEVATASGAARAGALFVLSTRSTHRIEDVAKAVAENLRGVAAEAAGLKVPGGGAAAAQAYRVLTVEAYAGLEFKSYVALFGGFDHVSTGESDGRAGALFIAAQHDANLGVVQRSRF